MAALRIVFVIVLMFLGEILNLAFSAGVDAQGCPQDWVHNDLSCYRNGTDSMNWTQADSYCQGLDSLLVVIESSEEQAFITKTFPTRVWLGCKKENGGGWVCMADGGTTKPMAFINWNPGEPDAPHSISCVYSTEGKWSDVGCRSRPYPLCERRAIAINTAPNQNTCPQFCHSHKYCTQN